MRTFFIAALLCTLLIGGSCKKKTTPSVSTVENGITYPDSIYNGKSILSLTDSTIMIDSKGYGFSANLEKDASLSIVVTDLITTVDIATGHFPDWSYANATGWTIQNWTANNLLLRASSQRRLIDKVTSSRRRK